MREPSIIAPTDWLSAILNLFALNPIDSEALDARREAHPAPNIKDPLVFWPPGGLWFREIFVGALIFSSSIQSSSSQGASEREATST